VKFINYGNESKKEIRKSAAFSFLISKSLCCNTLQTRLARFLANLLMEEFEISSCFPKLINILY